MRKFIQYLSAAVVATGAVVAPASVLADQYPSQTVQIVVPFPPGSITDIAGRVIAEPLSKRLGQPVVVVNRPGAGAVIGSAEVARAKPDGYTILFGGNSTNTINPYLFKSLPYDPEKSFAPITITGEIPTVIIARPELGFKSMGDLLAAAKKAPNHLSIAYGSTTSQVSIESRMRGAGIKLNAVPYKGEPLGMTDLLGGHVDLMILNLPVAYQHIQQGKAVALALPGNRRSTAMPEIPLASDTVPEYTMPNGWLAFSAPAGTPEAIIKRLHADLVAVLEMPEVKQRIEDTGGYMVYTSTPDELKQRERSDAARWAALIKASNIEPQ